MERILAISNLIDVFISHPFIYFLNTCDDDNGFNKLDCYILPTTLAGGGSNFRYYF